MRYPKIVYAPVLIETLVGPEAAASSGKTERVVNGDFSSATGWTAGSGWVISSGQAVGTAATGVLFNTLSESIASGASVDYSFDVTSAGGDTVLFVLYNSGAAKSSSITSNSGGSGTFAGTVTAGSEGPYDQLRIFDVDEADVVVIDNASLMA